MIPARPRYVRFERSFPYANAITKDESLVENWNKDLVTCSRHLLLKLKVNMSRESYSILICKFMAMRKALEI